MPRRQHYSTVEEGNLGRERLRPGKTPYRGLGDRALSKNSQVELEIVTRPCATRIDEAKADAVAAECPARIRVNAGSHRLAPCRRHGLVVSNDDGRASVQFQQAPAWILQTSVDDKAEDVEQRDDDAVGNQANAGRRPDRRRRSPCDVFQSPRRDVRYRLITGKRRKLVACERGRDESAADAGNGAYHEISENAGRLVTTRGSLPMLQLFGSLTAARQHHLEEFALRGRLPLNPPVEQPALKQTGRQTGMAPLDALARLPPPVRARARLKFEAT